LEYWFSFSIELSLECVAIATYNNFELTGLARSHSNESYTMKIKSEITYKEIHSAELKTSNNISDYFYINADICIEIEINETRYEATLQTGHSYHHGDYSLPSNSLSVYSEGNSGLLLLLDQNSISSQKDADYINDTAETAYTLDELLEIQQALMEVNIDAQAIISEAELEAEEELEADETTYVIQNYIEEFENGEKFQFGEPDLKKFDTEEEAETYISENSNSHQISKEKAWEKFKEQL